MRKKLLFLIPLACVSVAAISFAACGTTENEDGGKPVTPPQIELKESVAPVDILLFNTATDIFDIRAVYDDEGTTSPYSEYKLDDGEWASLPSGTGSMEYNDLTPGSQHTVYARCGVHDEYKASAEYSVTVTLDKSYDFGRPETVEYDVTEKTLTVALGDELEVSFDNRETWTTDGTYTYAETGTKTFYVRYKETDTSYAGSALSLSVKITDFAGGMGTEDNPYRIDTLERFKLLQTVSYLQEREWFALTDDIIFDDEIWNGMTFGNKINIDGRGHKLIAPKLSAPLFYNLDTAKNITVERAQYTAEFEDLYGTEASLLSWWLITAENVSVSGTITLTCDEMPNNSSSYYVCVGGIANILGESNSGKNCSMINCRADVTVTLPVYDGTLRYAFAFGGLAAEISQYNQYPVEISACSANINVTGGAIRYGDVGGLIGCLIASGDVEATDRGQPMLRVCDSYSTGSVALEVADGALRQIRIGGIAAAVKGGIERCYSTIDFDIKANINEYSNDTELLVGGITAECTRYALEDNVITNVFFAGSITVTKTSDKSAQNVLIVLEVICSTEGYAVNKGLYYDEAALTVPEGAEQVGSSLYDDTAVSSAELLSESWQKSTFGWDEEIWIIKDGELPVLK